MEPMTLPRGAIRKEPGGRLGVALVYPNAGRLAMANLGFHAVYRLFNDDPGTRCERVFLPELFAEELVGLGFGAIEIHLDLFKDDAFFLGHVVFPEERAEEHVGQDVEGVRGVFVENLGVEADDFLAGEGVGVAADGVELAGDFVGGAALGAFEEHVLDEMADSIFGGGFAAGA